MSLPSWLDMQIHAGDVLVSAMVAGLMWISRKAYKMGREFLDDARGNRAELDLTAQMVDRHTFVLRKHGLLEAPAPRVHGRRRSADHELDILEGEGGALRT